MSVNHCPIWDSYLPTIPTCRNFAPSKVLNVKNLIAHINADALELRITGRIYFGWTADDLRYEIDQALRQGIKIATVYLNTEGGSVYDASEIVNQLRRLQSVKIKAGALVASAGTYIMAHFPAEAYASSQFMIHKPLTQFTGNIDQMQADMKALENITTLYRTTYAKRFNKTEEEINTLWKQDYWFDASEALSLGLITQIIDGTPEYNDQTLAMMQACGCPKIPAPKQENNKKVNIQKMDRDKLIASLGLAKDATDEQITARINALREKETDEQAAAKTRAEKLVNQAILERKITADLKETYVGLATAEYDKTKDLLDKMQGVTPASETINHKPNASADDHSGWTIEDYIEKDPEALEALIDSDPEKVAQLNKQYLNSK
nr:MAG TPA: Putative ATP dependent Clp protease [Caudoviricetes sp.]